MKKGFTLIELIFTIVILAITTMAIPRIVAQTTELNALAIKEELVYNAKAFMSRISKAQWDNNWIGYATTSYKCEEGYEDGCIASSKARILTIDSNTIDGTEPRPGILEEPNKREVSPALPTLKRHFGGIAKKKGGLYRDVDDYDGFTTDITVGNLVGSSSKGDFILNTRINVDVDYAYEPFTKEEYAKGVNLKGVLSDKPYHFVSYDGPPPPGANNAPFTNIKMVKVSAVDLNDAVARDGNSSKAVVLKAFLSNIGVGYQTTATRRYY